MRGEWRSEPTWPAERLRPRVLAARGRRDGSDLRARRRRHRCVDLVRGQAAVDAPRRPARGRRALAHLRLAATRRRARDPRPPAAPARRHVAAPGGVPLGAALRRVPRRNVRAREPRRAEPHAPRGPRRPDAARAAASRRRSSSSSRRRRGSSSRAIASASRSRARTGPTRGRRRTGAPSRSARGSVELELPGSRGSCDRAAARSSRRHRRRPPPTSRTACSRRSCAGSSRTRSDGRRASSRATAPGTTARTTRRSRSSTTGSSAWRTATRGARGRAPGRATPSPGRRPAYGRRLTCSSAPRRSRYHVVVEVVASEDGPDGIGHVERRFERTIPRRLQ